MSQKKIKPNQHKHHEHAAIVGCRVCEMNGTGFHYGVVTCNACKAFYYRNTGKRHICKSNGKCDVTGRKRAGCPSCRMSKCNEMGMSRESCIRRCITADGPYGVQPQNTTNAVLEGRILSAHERLLTSIHYLSNSVIATIQEQHHFYNNLIFTHLRQTSGSVCYDAYTPHKYGASTETCDICNFTQAAIDGL